MILFEKDKNVKAMIHCEIYLSEQFMNTVSRAFHETWNNFLKYFYLSISVSLRMFFIKKKLCLQGKDIFWQGKFNSPNFHK